MVAIGRLGAACRVGPQTNASETFYSPTFYPQTGRPQYNKSSKASLLFGPPKLELIGLFPNTTYSNLKILPDVLKRTPLKLWHMDCKVLLE